MKKMITIIELPTFLARIGESISTEERDEFIDYIAKNPETGTVIPGTNGVRKVRWSSKNKGKRRHMVLQGYFCFCYKESLLRLQKFYEKIRLFIRVSPLTLIDFLFMIKVAIMATFGFTR